MALMFVISAPSGAGKTSLVQALIERDPQLRKSISHTTRPKRPLEVAGESYHFVSEPEFQVLAEKSAFLESAEVFGAHYGTSQAGVMGQMAQGHDVILEIDWQGAQQVRRNMPCIGIFILPPHLDVLAARLRGRGQDSEAVIQRRLQGAQSEMTHYAEYDYVVINDDFDKALATLLAIVHAARARTANIVKIHAEQIAALLNIDNRS